MTIREQIAKALPRFLRRLSPPALGTGCMEWTGCRFRLGYGNFEGAGECSAHRFAYLASFGYIPPGIKVLHRCDNRACCNPYHLFLGTQDDNMKDRHAKGKYATTYKGLRHHDVRLTPDIVREIRRSPETNKELGAKYGVSANAIRLIRIGRNWKSVKDENPLDGLAN